MAMEWQAIAMAHLTLASGGPWGAGLERQRQDGSGAWRLSGSAIGPSRRRRDLEEGHKWVRMRL
jgi:hypothetical protein